MTTSNYTTIIVDSSIQSLRYIAQKHNFQTWNQTFVSSSSALSNVIDSSNYYSAMAITTSNVDVSGDLRSSNVSLGNTSLYITAQHALAGVYVANAKILNVNQNITTTFTVNCSAEGNSSSYLWELLNGDIVIASGTGPSIYAFSGLTFTIGEKVLLTARVSTGTVSSTSACYSFVCTATPYININALTFPSVATIQVDGVSYYGPGTTYQVGIGNATFSNLVSGNYSGSAFLKINSSSYDWSSLFSTLPPSGIRTNTLAFPSTPALFTSSNVSFQLRNSVVGEPMTSNVNVLFTPGIVEPIILNSNYMISSATRSFANGTSLGLTDPLYAVIADSFVSGYSFISQNIGYAPAQSITGVNRRRLYINLAHSGIPLISFGVRHNSTISDIAVSWTAISSTYYSANTVYIAAGGCGAGAQSGAVWYIRRPIGVSQSVISSIRLYIEYDSSVNVMPIPVFL